MQRTADVHDAIADARLPQAAGVMDDAAALDAAVDAASASAKPMRWASIRAHAWPGQLPMQIAARRARAGPEPVLSLRFGDDDTYPLTVYRFSGSREAVVGEASALLQAWTILDPRAATANVIAVTEGLDRSLYMVPRHRFLEHAAGFPYPVGSMEVAGMFIYSKEEELQDLEQGRITFERLWTILQAIHPPAVERLG